MPDTLQSTYLRYKTYKAKFWNLGLLFDWNLPVSKSLVSFCSTGIGHVLEQENKSMKIQSRTKGVGNNESALEEHFLISYDWSQITKLFLESFVWIPPK